MLLAKHPGDAYVRLWSICNHWNYEETNNRNYKRMVIMKDYEKIGQEIGKLVKEKNAAYGDSFGRAGKVLEILYPKGIGPSQYTDFLTIIRVIDKLFRIATRKGAFGESPWKDIVGYGILGVANDEVDDINWVSPRDPGDENVNYDITAKGEES